VTVEINTGLVIGPAGTDRQGHRQAIADAMQAQLDNIDDLGVCDLRDALVYWGHPTVLVTHEPSSPAPLVMGAGGDAFWLIALGGDCYAEFELLQFSSTRFAHTDDEEDPGEHEVVRYTFDIEAELADASEFEVLTTPSALGQTTRNPQPRVVVFVGTTTTKNPAGLSNHDSPITTPVSEDVFTVGVLATPVTVSTRAFPNEIHKRNASVRVVQQPCPGLAAAIEAGRQEEIRRLSQQYVHALRKSAPGLRVVLLGCTHYELIAPAIAALLPKGVRLYHQPTIVAKSLRHYLQRHAAFAAALDATGSRQFFTTGDAAYASAISEMYLGVSQSFHQVAA
jgi:glutamate racemase